MSRKERLDAYRQMIIHLLGFCAALYRLITNEEAPKARDVL